MPKRSYKQISGTRTLKRMGYKKRYKRRGLIPQYRGWAPASLLRGEWKYSDIATNLAADQNGAQLLLNNLALGNTATTRVGNRIAIRSIEFRGYNLVTAGTGIDQIHRVVLFVDKQANATAPTLGDQLSANNYYSMRSLTQRKRFRIIIDKMIALNATGEPGSFKVQHWYMKFKRPLVVEYNAANNNTVADIVSNSLYVYAAGSAAAGVTSGQFYGTFRIRYTDV